MADRSEKCAEDIVANIACATQLEELRDENSDTYRTMVLNVVSGVRSHYPDDRELLEADSEPWKEVLDDKELTVERVQPEPAKCKHCNQPIEKYDGLWTSPLDSGGRTAYCDASRSIHAPAEPVPSTSVEQVIADAQKAVRPIVDRERQCEDVGDVMGFRMKGMNQQETFNWLLERHRKLLEIEASTSVESQVEPSLAGTISDILTANGWGRISDSDALHQIRVVIFKALGINTEKVAADSVSHLPLEQEAAKLAQFFHETYERLAPDFGYVTRQESAVPWKLVPERNKNLMVAVCKEVLALQSNDFNVRNLRNLVRAQMTGGDCFDLVGLARVLAKYAEPELSALRQWKREMIAVQELHEHLRPQIKKLLSPKQLGKPWMQGVLDELASLRSRLAEVEKSEESLRRQLATADAYFPDAAIAKVNAELRAESAESRLAEVEKERDAQWVSVEERLPENQDYSDSFVPLYIVSDKDGYALAERYDNEWWGEFGVIREVTHWRSLPEPPGAALGRDKGMEGK